MCFFKTYLDEVESDVVAVEYDDALSQKKIYINRWS